MGTFLEESLAIARTWHQGSLLNAVLIIQYLYILFLPNYVQ